LSSPHELVLLTPAEMAEADRRAVLAGIASLVLMEAAGQAVADVAAQMVSAGARIAVLCGPGNNGGDGYVAARLLAERGHAVSVYAIGSRDTLTGDAAAMAQRWSREVRPLSDVVGETVDLIIDALFGAGLTRPLDNDILAVFDSLRRAVASGQTQVLAVDVPSGLDGATGAILGDVLKADRTVTFFRAKPGHVLLPGRVACGDVVVADIGLPASVLTATSQWPDLGVETYRNDPGLWRQAFPRPSLEAHKFTRGHVVVVSGPAHATGAARLGARGALRVGAGRVTLVGDMPATTINAAHATAVMVRQISGTAGLADFLLDARRNAVLIGPGAGVGADTAADALAALSSDASVVLDADALTSFAGLELTGRFGFIGRGPDAPLGPDDLFQAIAARSAPVVLTPHEGEFGRLFGDLAGSKLDRAREAATTSGAIVVLKGADTVIAAPDGRAAINANAPPTLATAGSGDVLAGFITGLLAQGMAAFEATCAAVWLHGACASHFGPGLIAEDLPEQLPAVLRKLGEAS